MDSLKEALPPYRPTIEAAWIDYNGHLRDAYYVVMFSAAIDSLMDHVGLHAAYRERTACTLYTVEVHAHYLQEVRRDDELTLENVVLDADRRRIHAGCVFRCARLAEPVAVAEAMLLHVHQGEKVSIQPFPDDIDARLQSLRLSPEALARFAPGSRRIEIRRR